MMNIIYITKRFNWKFFKASKTLLKSNFRLRERYFLTQKIYVRICTTIVWWNFSSVQSVLLRSNLIRQSWNIRKKLIQKLRCCTGRFLSVLYVTLYFTIKNRQMLLNILWSMQKAFRLQFFTVSFAQKSLTRPQNWPNTFHLVSKKSFAKKEKKRILSKF